MSLASATWFLVMASARNRLRRWRKRLQQPRYLLATIAAATYLYFLLFRRITGPTTTGFQPPLQELELVFIGLVVISVLLTWLFGKEDAVLNFSPAEVQLLFPAPVSRRRLILYRINRNLGRALISAIFSTVIFGRNVTGHPVLFTLAFWLGISTLMLHGTAASFARQSLAEHGLSALKRRVLTVALVAAGVGALAQFSLPPLQRPYDEYAARVIELAPLSYLLWPVRALTRLIVAPSLRDFLHQAPAALLVFAAHYVWAATSKGAFEEASLEAAEARALVREQRRSPFRGVKVVRSSRAPWAGPPAMAIAWKNALAMRRALGLRVFPVVLVITAAVFVFSAKSSVRELAGLFCLATVGVTTVMGPTWARFDFRADLKHMDLLRALPLSGRQMVLGELLTPAVLLAVAQWALLAAGAVLVPEDRLPVSLSQRIAGAIGIAIVVPFLTGAGLVLQNAIALLYPDWVASTSGPQRGVEVLGQRLITLLAALVLLAVTVFPSALVAGIALLVLHTFGPFALVIAGISAAGVLSVELFFGVVLLGRLYDRFHVAQ